MKRFDLSKCIDKKALAKAMKDKEFMRVIAKAKKTIR